MFAFLFFALVNTYTMKNYLILFLLLAIAATARAQHNVLLIIADDLGWADVAFHGGNAPTPHLDRLKRCLLYTSDAADE